MTHRHDRTLNVSALARVEGEGAMHVRVRDGLVEEVRLDIYEPPRFFEAFLYRYTLEMKRGLTKKASRFLSSVRKLVPH